MQKNIFEVANQSGLVASSGLLDRTSPKIDLPESTASEPTRIPSPHSLIGLLPLVFVMVWAIAVLWSNRGKAARERQWGSQRHPQIPCKTCRFFKDNPHLKCAVHPVIASTKNAIECSDYSPNTRYVSVKDTYR